MNTNSDFITPHIMNTEMPSSKGTFSILPSGTIIGYPDSTAVTMWHYLVTGTLVITYTGGSKYFYKKVPFTDVMRMLTANSLGEYINKVIKPNYEFWKASL
jgi:hypothetical protein